MFRSLAGPRRGRARGARVPLPGHRRARSRSRRAEASSRASARPAQPDHVVRPSACATAGVLERRGRAGGERGRAVACRARRRGPARRRGGRRALVRRHQPGRRRPRARLRRSPRPCARGRAHRPGRARRRGALRYGHDLTAAVMRCVAGHGAIGSISPTRARRRAALPRAAVAQRRPRICLRDATRGAVAVERLGESVIRPRQTRARAPAAAARDQAPGADVGRIARQRDDQVGRLGPERALHVGARGLAGESVCEW